MNRKSWQCALRLVATLLLLAPAAHAQQGEAKTAIQFLSSETIAEVNLDSEAFLSYAQAFNNDLQAAAAALNRPCELRVQQTLHPSQPVSVEIAGSPALSEAERQKIKARLLAITAPHTRFTDFSLLYVVSVNGGAKEPKASFVPAVPLPAAQARAAFEALPMSQQYQQLRAWAGQEALPILAAFEAKTNARFAGVQGMGTTLEKLGAGPRPATKALTDLSNTYWRGCLEMDPRNQLVPTTKVLLYAAEGELGLAELYLTILEPVSDPKSVAAQLGDELRWRLQAFNQKVDAEIKAGIALNDQGKYDEALAAYEKVLAVFPASAWANFEKFFSERARFMAQHDGVPDDAEWERARKLIYAANPMYPSVAQLSSAKDVYQYVKRQELTTLFKSKETFKTDYATYADTALLLGEYGLAAQMNWIIFSSFGKDGEPDSQRLATFLYCLDKLGNQQIATNFKGDFKKQFAAIDDKLDKDMKESAAYRSFKKK
jgi:tetratricopeptide (TPR) repeat protein